MDAKKINNKVKSKVNSKYRTKGDKLEEFPVDGKFIPPHSLDAEMAVLGAMLLDRTAISRSIEILELDSFYDEANKKIYSAIIDMFEKGIAVDLVSLTEELRKRKQLEEVGGPYYLATLSSKIATPANVEHYCMIVQEKYLKRQLIKSAHEILANCFDDSIDAFDEIDRAESKIFSLAEKRFQQSYQTLGRLATDAYSQIYKLFETGKPGITGVPSGFTELDNILGGFQKSDFIVIAARPAMGKTALGLSIARNVAFEYKKPVAFFSIEMSAIQLAIRLISAEAQVNQHKIRTGRCNQKDMHAIASCMDNFRNAPFIIDDSPMLTPMELRAKCRRLKAEQKIELLIVDYLQLMHGVKAETREREISIISNSLKQIAKELDIPVIALSQLNRSVESRADKRPMLYDLRESGSIEQDADVVLFIYRPEFYGIKKYENGTPTEGTAEIIVGKQRNGPIGSCKLAYIKDYARFENLAYNEQDIPPEYISDVDIDENTF